MDSKYAANESLMNIGDDLVTLSKLDRKDDITVCDGISKVGQTRTCFSRDGS